MRGRTHGAGLQGEDWEVRDEGTEGKAAQGLRGSSQGQGQERPQQGRRGVPAKQPSGLSRQPGPAQPRPPPAVLGPKTRCESSGC